MASGARDCALEPLAKRRADAAMTWSREFAQELPHTTPADAWQRAVLLVADCALNLDAEPRVKKAVGRRAAQGSHPSSGPAKCWSIRPACPPSRGRAAAGRETEAARWPTSK